MKLIGLTAFALVLVAANGAEAQTVISRQITSRPVETVVTRQANGSVTTQTHIMTSKPAAMHTVQHLKRAKPAQKIVYRTIVREVPVEPETIVERVPVTRWVPGLFGPYPVTTIEDRAVYTGAYRSAVSVPPYGTSVDAMSYSTPAYRVIGDEDAYTPARYVIRY